MQPYPYPQPQQPPQAPAPYAPAQPPALPPGTILLDRYLIQGYIGGGGFGHIYKALDNALGYRRAIKEAFFHDPWTRRQFQLEAEFLFNTRHPNLVGAYALFEQAGRLYLVMDYVDGHTLEEVAIDHIRRHGCPLPEARILDWVIPVCGALHALHASPVPIIHRDVKPANVKINRHGVPILIDLGLAKLHAQGTKTIGAALAFTPGYAPPEQYRASGATDARTDVYGMGASLFFLLTGYQPTEAPARLGSLAVPPLRQLNPRISPLTEVAVVRAMALLPEQRQQSAWQLEQDLRAARAALGAGLVAANVGSAPAGVVCLVCQTPCPPGARHCMRCGAQLVEGGGVAPRVARTNPLDEAIHIQAVEGAQGPAMAAPPAPPAEPDPTAAAQPDGEHAPAGAMEAAGASDLAVASEGAPVAALEHEAEPGATASGTADEAEPEATASGTADEAEARVDVPALAEDAAPADQAEALTDDDSGRRLDATALVPGPDSLPDQPAMVMPPLRRGPAPAAMLLHPAAPDAPSQGSTPHQVSTPRPARPAEPLWHHRSQPRPSRPSRPNQPRQAAPSRGRPPELARAASTAGVGGGRWQEIVAVPWLALRAVFMPNLAQWHAQTLAAAAPEDEREVRVGLAGMLALVLAVVTLASVRYWVALAFAVPALFLGHWCLDTQTPRPVPEARWLAKVALVTTYTWLALYVLGNLLVALKAR